MSKRSSGLLRAAPWLLVTTLMPVFLHGQTVDHYRNFSYDSTFHIGAHSIGLVKTATNPCAATLFVDFELTGGQDVFADKFRIGSVPTGEDPLAGLEVYPVPEEKLLDDPDTWNSAYEDVLANGQALD